MNCSLSLSLFWYWLWLYSRKLCCHCRNNGFHESGDVSVANNRRNSINQHHKPKTRKKGFDFSLWCFVAGPDSTNGTDSTRASRGKTVGEIQIFLRYEHKINEWWIEVRLTGMVSIGCHSIAIQTNQRNRCPIDGTPLKLSRVLACKNNDEKRPCSRCPSFGSEQWFRHCHKLCLSSSYRGWCLVGEFREIFANMS